MRAGLSFWALIQRLFDPFPEFEDPPATGTAGVRAEVDPEPEPDFDEDGGAPA